MRPCGYRDNSGSVGEAGCQAVEELQEGIGGLEASLRAVAGGGAVQDAFLGAQVGMQVLLGGGDVLVPQP